VATRTKILLGLLAAAVGLYLYSRTQSGSAAVAYLTQYVGDLLSGPRGIRNNNPGNIRRNGIAWQGLLSQADCEAAGLTYDATFCQFDTPANGVRAIGRILTSYSSRGLVTVDSIIREWSATDQDAYVANVAAALQVDPQETIDVQSQLPALAIGIIQQEEGQQPYAVSDIQSWVYQ
jgi:hypothetical protein